MSSDGKEASLEAAKAMNLADLVEYQAGAIVSRTLKKNDRGTITLFAIDEGEEISEHSAPFDAFVIVIEGKIELTIGGRKIEAKAGEITLMPANIPHALKAPERFKMLLVMIKG